jgi:(2Fe-2S) ferredoxin
MTTKSEGCPLRFRYHIFVCENRREPADPRGCCAAKGSEALREAFKQEIKRLGLKGRVRANKAGCLDACAFGPSVVIYPEGVWYRVTTQEEVREVMEQHVRDGKVVEHLLMPIQRT